MRERTRELHRLISGILALGILLLDAPDARSAMNAAQVLEIDNAGALFGWSVAGVRDVNGDGFFDILVGAPNYSNGEAKEGAIFLFHGSASGFVTPAAWTYESDQAGANLGWSVAHAGDVNGDGLPDLVVGAPGWSNGQTHEGRVLLFLNSATGFPSTPSWSYESDQAEAFLGHAVAGSETYDLVTVPSFDGGSYGDIAVGVPGWDGGEVDEGRVLVFYGSATGPAATPDWSAESNQAGAEYGYAVASAGDVNGDQVVDLVIGAMRYDGPTGVNSGRVEAFHGSATGLAATADWVVHGSNPDEFLGGAVSAGGDMNKDNYGDVVISAWSLVNADTITGGVCFFLGSSTGLPPTPAVIKFSTQLESNFGFGVGYLGPFDADSRPEVAIGSFLHDVGTTLEDAGQALAYSLASGNSSANPKGQADGAQAESFFGHSVAGAGFVNGDFYADMVVGAPWYSNGQNHEGAVYLYFGAANLSGGGS